MSKTNSFNDRDLVEKLDSLRAVPPRDPGEMQRRRAVFLSEVSQAAASAPVVQENRSSGLNRLFGRMWIKPMVRSIAAVLVAISLALGGAGLTVAAAQSALPGEALYGIKTASEDVRLALSGEETRLELNLEFSQRRIEEMTALIEAGQEVPETLLARLQAEITSAFEIAASQQDEVLVQMLEQLRASLQKQEQQVLNLEEQEQVQNQTMLQSKEILRNRLQLVEEGLLDPGIFREQVGEGLNRPTGTPQPGTGSPGEPQVTPGAGTGEPGYGTGEPGYGTGEPGYGTQEPGSGTGEPGYGTGEPGYGTGEPGYGTGEPGYGTQEPQPTPGEPQPTPGGTGEPQPTPGGTGEPRSTPGGGTGEPQPTQGNKP